MSTLKVNSIEGATGGEVDINATLGSIPSLVITGVTTVSAGSAAAPSITPTGDSNTGIFFPSADTIAFSEGGVEAARFDSSGRLGIGVSAPSSLLHVEGTVGNAKIRLGTGGDHTLIGPDSSGHTIINAGTSGANMQLQLAGTTKVTLNSTGLGIGAQSPSAQFVVSNGGAAGLEVSPTGFSAAPVIVSYNRSGAAYTQLTLDGASNVFAISGTERARIDSSGRLLVGTSSNRNNLKAQVEGTSSETASLSVFRNSNDANPAILVLGKSRGTSVNSKTVVSSGDRLGIIAFHGSDGTQDVEGAYIETFVDGTPGANDMPSRLVFSTTADGASSPTERFRISNLGVPRFFSSDSGILSAISAGSGTNENIFVGLFSATNTTSGSVSFLVKASGNVQNTNNSYGAISDAKLKENIVNATSQWDDLKALQVRKYNFKAETNQQTHTQIGLVAQEVELVSPGLVSESPDRDAEGNDLGTVTKSVNYSVLYMKAVKALQEAMERIEQLEAKVVALESKP